MDTGGHYLNTSGCSSNQLRPPVTDPSTLPPIMETKKDSGDEEDLNPPHANSSVPNNSNQE